MFQKAGSGSISTRISLPKDWVNAMGITPENRQVTATFDEEKRTIHIQFEKQE
jgi:hypothetical protein